jgi:hypothetical protein
VSPPNLVVRYRVYRKLTFVWPGALSLCPKHGPVLTERTLDSYRGIIWYMAVRKWSVSVDEELAARVEAHVSDRGLSSFVAKAVEHELERDALSGYLEGLDAEFGPVPSGLLEQYDESWPS